MGNCCLSKLSEKFAERASNEQIDDWLIGNSNIDYQTFLKSFPTVENKAFQSILSGDWKDIELPVPSTDFSHGIDEDNFAKLKPSILRGVPSHQINAIIRSIFLLDDSIYKTLLEATQVPPLDFKPEPLFGRDSLSNIFLTRKGSLSCKRLLYMISLRGSPIEICLLLPRVVQMLLWFLGESEVFHLIQILFTHNYYFPTAIADHKGVMTSSNLCPVIFADIVFNLAVGYVQPCYYPQALVVFLADGIVGMMKFASALMEQHAEIIQKMIKEGTNPELMIKLFQKESLEKTRISRVLIESHFMDFNVQSTNEDCRIVYEMPFGGDSKILNTNQKCIGLLPLLPSAFTNCQLSILTKVSFGNLKLRKSKASLIIVASANEDLVGLFLDRSVSGMNSCYNSQCRLIDFNNKQCYSHLPDHEISIRTGKEFCLIYKE